nr:hypothetical protein [Pedobacter sp. ASV19]
MAIAKITIWLKDSFRDYQYGVLLYNEYGKNDLLKVILQNGDSAYHQDRLYTALEELNPTLEELTNKPAFKFPSLDEITVPVKRYGINDDQWDNLPDQIKDLYVQNSKLHSHSRMLFDQARIAPTDAERLSYGLQILSERKSLNNNWKAIKDYHENGQLKETVQKEQELNVQDLSVLDLIKEWSNLPTYISKAKKALKNMTPGQKMDKAKLRLQELEIRMETVKKRVEGLS